jgi:hypothetical protein
MISILKVIGDALTYENAKNLVSYVERQVARLVSEAVPRFSLAAAQTVGKDHLREVSAIQREIGSKRQEMTLTC